MVFFESREKKGGEGAGGAAWESPVLRTRAGRFLSVLLGPDAMGLFAIIALGLALQTLLFGVPQEVKAIFKSAQLTVFFLFAAEYLFGFLLAEKKGAYALKAGRIFDFAILFLVSLSFLPEVEDRLLNSQALQFLRYAPVLIFGYLGTKDLALQVFEEERVAVIGQPQFFSVEETEDGCLRQEISEEEVLRWVKDPGRGGFFVCRGDIREELAELLAPESVPSELLKNALEESSFPRSVHFGKTYVFSAAIPALRANGRGGARVAREPFVAIFTAGSVLLVDDCDAPLAEEVFCWVNTRQLFVKEPQGFRFLAGLYSVLHDHYESCALELESEVRREELRPLEKSGGRIYRKMYLLRRTISGLKSDLWRLRRILHGIEELRHPTIFNDRAHLEFYTLLAHQADFLYENFEELEDKASAVLDLRINLTSFEMNRFMGLLAVVTAVGLIPATISGLLGMNIEGTNFPVTLGNVVLLCVMAVLVVLYVMRLWGWLRFR